MCFLWGCDSLSGEIQNHPMETLLFDADWFSILIKVVLTLHEFYYYNFL